MSYNKETGLYEGYIYKVTNTINNKVYVGQTITTISRRWRNHISDSRRSTIAMPLHFAIRKYGEENFNVQEVIIVAKSSKKELRDSLNEYEKFYISLYKSLVSQDGYNVDKGGNANNACAKRVVAYDLDGNVLNSFDCINDAADYYGVEWGCIQKVCTGIQGNSHNIVFRYEHDSFDKYDTSTKKYFPVYMFSQDGILLKEFNGPTEAGRFINQSSVTLDNPYRTNGGYWFSRNKIFNYQGSKTSVAIDVYDLNGMFIKSYNQINTFCAECGIKSANVSKVLNGKRKSVGGFVVRRKGESFNKYLTQRIPNHHKSVNQYSLDGQYINSFTSIKDAQQKYGSYRGSLVRKRCNDSINQLPAYGYYWYYADDPDQPDKTKIFTEVAI